MLTKADPTIRDLGGRIESRAAVVGVCGMGYVGLPLAIAAANAGFHVLGFDIDETKAESLNNHVSYIDSVTDKDLQELDLAAGGFHALTDFTRLGECDVIVVCVPTPLSHHREPDLSFVEATSRTIAASLHAGQLIVIESTTYPGTTAEIVKPILEKTGLRSGVDFFLGYSPEREDPGNRTYSARSIPKVVSGDGPLASEIVCRFYQSFVSQVVPVSTTQTAEAVKLTENIFRAVNIGLVNELKVIYTAMGIDIWEVIEAAKTKPFGYMPFYPGPGLGGHCIPIDPFYLTWKAREYGVPTRFIELAGEINVAMPRYVVERLALALDDRRSLPLSRARILIIGVSYKPNVADMRESPSLALIELIETRRAKVAFHDPLVPVIPPSREHMQLAGRRSTALSAATVAEHDAILIATDHDGIDYALIAEHAHLIVDTRNALERRGLALKNVVKA